MSNQIAPSFEQLRFDGRVVVITGAGRGIGRAHADLLAARGARVMVNDIGSSMSGTGRDDTPAEQAVAAIRAAGGTADADFSDISSPHGAQQLIEHTVDVYGRVDALINNAGIYVPDHFPDMELTELHDEMRVHVDGSFNVAQACWSMMARAGYGRMVFTTSTGALGAATLVGYATAKAAVLGMGRALAVAGRDVGIRVNMVAPSALTRMRTLGIDDLSAIPADPGRHPSLVSPLVAVLCHESCPVNGETFVGGMRRYARLFIAETEGYVHPDVAVTAESVMEHWSEIESAAQFHETPDLLSWIAQNEERIPGLMTLERNL